MTLSCIQGREPQPSSDHATPTRPVPYHTQWKCVELVLDYVSNVRKCIISETHECFLCYCRETADCSVPFGKWRNFRTTWHSSLKTSENLWQCMSHTHTHFIRITSTSAGKVDCLLARRLSHTYIFLSDSTRSFSRCLSQGHPWGTSSC